MRKFFLGLMLSSALGAIVIGGALAWTGSTNTTQAATGATIAFSLDPYTPTGLTVADNNTWVNVANGGIHNTGDVTIHVTSGSVATPSNPSAYCGVYGQVRVPSVVNVAPGGFSGVVYGVDLAMPAQGNDNTCMGASLPYTLTINVAS